MHLLIYTQDILHAYGLSTPFTVAVFVGSAYGCLRLVIDLAVVVARTPENVQNVASSVRRSSDDDEPG